MKEKDVLESIPLFASNLNSDAGRALQSIIDDTKPEDRAISLKESGNKGFKLGPSRWDDALVYYQQALDLQCPDKVLNASIHSNRALIFLKQKQFGRCIKECQQAKVLDPTNVKVSFRAAKALMCLEKYKDALEWCYHHKENGKIADLKISIEEALSLKEKMEEEARVKLETEKKEKDLIAETLEIALKSRGYRFGEDRFRTSAYPKLIELYEGRTAGSPPELSFSVLLIYEEVSQSDLIKAFQELDTFQEHLDLMFPPKSQSPSWDPEGVFRVDNLKVYFKKQHNGKEKSVMLSRETRLGKVLRRSDYMIPRIPVFFVKTAVE